VIKRISLLVTAALLVATMAMAGLAGPAFAAPADPKPPPDTSGPGETDGADKPGTCTTTTQKGANVTISETQGSCKNDKVDPDPEGDKKAPGQFKPAPA
jgi:predicted small lipoprotein YifL